MANYSVSSTVNGLGTFNFGVPNTGTYSVQGNITLPSIDQGSSGSSQVVVTIAINGGSAIYTGAAGAQGFSMPLISMSAGNILNITLSSSAPVDQGLNIIKTTISLSEVS